MILTAHQPVYLPWLGLFHKIALADKFIFFDQVQYVPKDYISRNTIKTPNGALLLSVPVLTKGYLDKTISKMEINNTTGWNKKHWNSIYLSYKKAPYFDKYSQFLEGTYKQEWQYLADLNLHMLQWFLEMLEIDVPVERAGEYHFEGAKSDLVLDMCKQTKADTYIFGALGADYADISKFKAANIDLVFQEYHHPEYHQLYGDFLPCMSTLDLLMNEGPNSLDILMSNNLTKNEILEKNE